MTQQEKHTVEWSDKILQNLLEERKRQPDLKFWLRHRNTNNRIDNGFWFQGNERYIFVGFFNRSGGTNMTRSIGFVVSFNEARVPTCYIEIVCNEEQDKDVLDYYNAIIERIGNFEQTKETRWVRYYESTDILENLQLFLNEHKPIMDEIIREKGIEDKMLLTEAGFSTSLQKIQKKRRELRESEHNIKMIVANITWNSKDWKEVSEDASGHAWVKGGNIPHESWNFDFDNERNNETDVLGFAQFSKAPDILGTNNLVIFYSQGKIVGFYGKSEILSEKVDINEHESYNIIGKKDFSLVLDNKIDDIKEKGYLEEKQRVGQIGFTYLESPETALKILNEAKKLNTEKAEKIDRIIDWIEDSKSNYWVFQANPDKVYRIEEALKAGVVSSWKVSTHQEHIKIGDKVILRVGGKLQGIYGLATVTSNVGIFPDLEEEAQYYFDPKDSGDGERVKIKLDYNLVNSPIPIESLKNHPELDELLGGNAGTNFRATKKQYDAIKNIVNQNHMNNIEIDLNQILFGPPGTGKTYHTINEAIKIADPDFYAENSSDRDALKKRFKLLLINANDDESGQIAFTTFHQSFSYEDFVEGIKPVEPKDGDEFLKYQIEEGIFKKICRMANDSLKAIDIDKDALISLSEEEFEKSDFYKMSLGNSQYEEDDDIFDYCVENNCITIGFGDGLDFTGKDERELKDFGREEGLESFPIQAMNLFKNYLKVDNYVVISHGNNYIRAIGKVTSDYEFKGESPFPNNSTFNHFRKVEWIFTDKEIASKDIYHKNLQQQTIYKLVKNEIKKDFFVKEKKVDLLKLPKNPKNFVIVVDEINRGNVSSIFGELITLIEKDKRAGGTEELSVILPYSKKEFKVPQNVFIIGTMNTADRSIEALDTALRRRFSFREMPPKSGLISNEGKLKSSNGKIGNVDVVKILDTINNRIEKLIDKDHKIGHSYFLDIENENDLKSAFNDKVIPLLEEYFFGDFGKIGLILGDSFITKSAKDDVTFADFEGYDTSVANDLMERSVFEITPQNNWDFESIYK